MRWVEKEAVALAQLRTILKDELATRPQYPDGKANRTTD
jgi:hypothetical protein